MDECGDSVEWGGKPLEPLSRKFGPTANLHREFSLDQRWVYFSHGVDDRLYASAMYLTDSELHLPDRVSHPSDSYEPECSGDGFRNVDAFRDYDDVHVGRCHRDGERSEFL